MVYLFYCVADASGCVSGCSGQVAGRSKKLPGILRKKRLFFDKQSPPEGGKSIIKVVYMGFPAARIGDMHICPMATPGTPPVPHVGGPVTGPGCPTVLIGEVPASVVGDLCTCVGPPDSIAMGSTTVLIGNKPAARMGDTTVHGGKIVIGCATVLIG